jgi:hypothetical protein
MTDKDFKITDDPIEGDDDNIGFNAEEEDDEHDTDHDHDDDDDDDDDILNVPFLVAGVLDESGRGGGGKKQKTIPTKPPDGLEWDDNAIIDCWNVTVASHHNHSPTKNLADAKMTTTTDEADTNLSAQYIWKEPIFGRKDELSAESSSHTTSAVVTEGAAAAVANLLESWKPKSLTIPMTAADEEEEQ